MIHKYLCNRQVTNLWNSLQDFNKIPKQHRKRNKYREQDVNAIPLPSKHKFKITPICIPLAVNLFELLNLSQIYDWQKKRKKYVSQMAELHHKLNAQIQ